MTLPIANRNDDQYSSDMDIKELPVVTSQFPVTHRHMDDDSICDSPDFCKVVGRAWYIRGGRPEANWAEREGWS